MISDSDLKISEPVRAAILSIGQLDFSDGSDCLQINTPPRPRLFGGGSARLGIVVGVGISIVTSACNTTPSC